MIDGILSSLRDAPASDFVYSSLSFFGRHQGGELPGTWFVNAIGALSVEAQAIRQTLFRMENAGALQSRRDGRVKWYRATPTTLAIMDAGVSRVATPADDRWDGQWTLVHFRVGENEREKRDRLRDVLLVEGFGALGPGLYVHPRDRTQRLLSAAKALGVHRRLNVFRGTHVAGANAQQLVHETWDVAALAARYNKFIRRYDTIGAAPSAQWTPFESFALRFAFMFEFFRISWDDPSLPTALLPEGWPGETARRLAATLTRKLSPRALEFANATLDARRPAGTGVR